MALNKIIKQPDGINTEYHRISKLEIKVNKSNNIEVISYVNVNARQIQKDIEIAAKDMKETILTQPYSVTTYHSLPYDETMSIEGAYNTLKKLPEFEGAIDVLEEGQVLSLSKE